ncbi:cupin domain-containing protein [Celeribacter sp.]|uniref:cupin domain-containing protein n=1 Tax=Celeribacter sp. TaxID=1890673 RepID=UPI003A9398E7
MPLSFKRVVTANSESGRSYILHDAPPSQIAEQPGRALTFYELWETDGPLASNAGTEDAAARPVKHHPPEGGTRFRIVELLPDTQQRADAVDQDFDSIAASNIQVEGSDDPTMHRNETVDYNIIISGEVVAVTDDAETLLRAGDVLIQRGTAHTWHNRSNAPCVFASVMVSAAPLPQFAK